MWCGSDEENKIERVKWKKCVLLIKAHTVVYLKLILNAFFFSTHCFAKFSIQNVLFLVYKSKAVG